MKAPPPGINSIHRATLDKVDRIETPDKLTVVFHMKEVDAAIMKTFASPWNCLYSAAKLSAPPYVAIGVFVIDQWRQIGVKAEHQSIEMSAWFNAMNNANFDAIMDAYIDHSDDPTTGVVKFLSQTTHPVSSARFEDPELYRLYNAQGRAPDFATRRQLVRDFEQRTMEQAYVIPLLWWYRIVVTSNRLNGWTMSPGHMLYQDLASVWLTPQ